MELPEIVDFARNFSAMVRISGPDPKGVKMRNHAFHQFHSGKTTLSASGMLLPQNLRKFVEGSENSENGALVVTVASIIEPFLTQKSKLADAQGVPELIPSAKIDVMVEVKQGKEQNSAATNDGCSQWFGAQVIRLVDVPVSSAAIQSLIEASYGSSEHGWEVGWSLASQIDSPYKVMAGARSQEKSDITSGIERQRILAGEKPSNVNLMAMSATRIAFLQISTLLEKDLPEIMTSSFNKRGDTLLSMGSPFGILSPLHFFNSIMVGSISNCYPSMSPDKSLLMGDMRCLPGMEGGPVFGEHACLIGILSRPLRQTGGAEIQVIIPWKAIQGTCIDLSKSMPHNVERGMQYTGNLFDARTSLNCLNCGAWPDSSMKRPLSYSSPLMVERAMSSVCLITLDSGVWASGVLLNTQGLILTNAHLLEPWRFGRTAMQTSNDDNKMKNLLALIEDSRALRPAEECLGDDLQSNALQPRDYLHKEHGSHPIQQFHKRLRVRVDSMNSWSWCNARVLYVSKGSLDVSLLQLESVPGHLCPVAVDLNCPSIGSKAFVIGHGLLGPRCDMFPSVCAGVVVKVVKVKKVMPHSAEEVPVMLETSASVHPGGSGGAVVNSSGHMIGLVTSNAKHGGGTIIPHMNFSIPSAALDPIFIFAKDMKNVSALQQLDSPNKDLASVWAMMPAISSERGPALPDIGDLHVNEKQKPGKGSRFVNFMKERHEMFRQSRQIGRTDDLSRDTIPSKL